MIRQKSFEEGQTCLYLVATPIGNLDDMTFRGVKTLRDADLIAADKQVIYCVTRGQGTLTTKRNFENIYIRLEEYIKNYLFLKERISKEVLNDLNWCGGRYWVIALQNKYSIAEWYKLTALMIRNRLPIWDKRFISKSIRNIKKEKALKK